MKTLIIRFGRLGDLLLTLPALRDLSAAEPGPEHERHFLVLSEYEELLAPLPEIDKLWTLPRGAGDGELRQLAERLAEQGFDRVIDLHVNLRSRLLRRRLGPVPRGWWRGPRGDLHRRLMLSHRLWPSAWRRREALRPVWLRHRDTVARALGDAYRLGEETPYPVPAQARASAELALAAAGLPADACPLAIVPGAAWSTKIWPHFPDLATSLATRQPLLVLGGPGEEALCEELAGPGVTLFCGPRPLTEVAAALSRCRGLVSGDSGLGHLAEALGLPVLTLFGPTVPAFGFPPRGPDSRVLERDLPCRPCSLHGSKPCRYGHGDCLGGIRPEHVLGALGEMDLAP